MGSSRRGVGASGPGTTNPKTALQKLKGWVKKHPIWSLVIGLVLAAIVGFVTLMVAVYVKFDSVQKDGNAHETTLNSSYVSAQNELGTQLSKIEETFGVAQVKSTQGVEALTDAIKGRYEEGSSAVGATGGGQLISALVEAYPELKFLDSYDRVIDVISAGREAYKNKQNVLLDQLRAYDKWRRSGIIHNIVVGIVGFPSDGLEARIGDTVTHGEDARDQMYRIVLPSKAREAYETGTLDPTEFALPGEK